MQRKTKWTTQIQAKLTPKIDGSYFSRLSLVDHYRSNNHYNHFSHVFFQRYYVVWGICIGTNKSYIYKVFIALNVNRLNFYWHRRFKRASGSKEKNVPLGPLQQYTRRLHPEFHLSFYRRSAKRFSNTRAKKDSFVTKKNSENIAPQYVCLRPWCWFSSTATANLSPC